MPRRRRLLRWASLESFFSAFVSLICDRVCVCVLLASWWTKHFRWDFWFFFRWSPEGKLSESEEGKPPCVCIGAQHELSLCARFEPNSARNLPLTISPSAECVCACLISPFFRRNHAGLPLIFRFIFVFAVWALVFVCVDTKFFFFIQISSPFHSTALASRHFARPSHVASLLATWVFQSACECLRVLLVLLFLRGGPKIA